MAIEQLWNLPVHELRRAVTALEFALMSDGTLDHTPNKADALVAMARINEKVEFLNAYVADLIPTPV